VENIGWNDDTKYEEVIDLLGKNRTHFSISKGRAKNPDYLLFGSETNGSSEK